MDKPTAILGGRLYNAFAKTLDMNDGSSFESDIHSSPIDVQATTAKRLYRMIDNNTDQTNCQNNAHTTTRDNNPINPGSQLPRQEKSDSVLHRRGASYRGQQQRQDPRSKSLPLSHHELPKKLRGRTEHMNTTTDPSLTPTRMTKLHYSPPPFGNRQRSDWSRIKNERNQARLETVLEEKSDEEREGHEERGRSRRQRRG